MGKHAAPATPTSHTRAVQRATAVAAGTFVLCLGAAAPAMATTGLPNPPLPIPIPQPIVDTVQTVSDATGLPNPLAPDSVTPKAHHRHAATHTTKTGVTLHDTTRTHRSTPTAHTPTGVALPQAAPVSFMRLQTAPTYRTAPLAGRIPAMASQTPVTRIAPAAGSRPLASLPAVPHQDTARILLLAVAVMLVGGLTSGHLKAIQQG